MFKSTLKILMIFLILYTSTVLAANYKGEKVSLVFKDADLKNVLMLFAEYENKNFLIDQDVKGTITIRLKNVPWQQALKIILEMKNLKKIVEGNVVRIVTNAYVQKMLQEKRERELEKIKEQERKKKLAPLHTKIISVNFAKVSNISSNIKSLLSDRGKVITDIRTNSFIVTDIDRNIKKIEKIVKVLDRPTPQVIIEAKIIVIKNTASKELGIQWGGSFVQRMTSKDFFYGITGASGGSSVAMPTTNIEPPGTSQKAANYNPISVPGSYVVNAPTVQAPVGGLGLIFGKWGYYNLSVKLTALKSKNMAKEISAPKVIALDNEKAVIEQGQQIPYKTVSDAGTKTEFKDATLKLEVTPHITPNKMVLLDLNLSKDSIGQQTTDGPAINTQSVKTKLLLKDGETAVIGGIISNAETQGQDSLPFFSDLPIVGFLFKNNIKSNVKGELLIFITPHVVERKVATVNQLPFNDNVHYNKISKNKSVLEKKNENLNKAKVLINLSVREKPLLSSKRVTIIKKGRIVTILQRKDRPWYYIDYKGIKGYVFYKYLEELK